jgi:hypothetical protein
MTRLAFAVSLFIIAGTLFGICEEPLKANLCEVKANPPAFNHKLVEITAFVSHDFEDFTLFDPACDSWPNVWLEYGGNSKSGTMYCCGVTADKQRPEELVVENIPVPLVTNELFVQLDKAIQPPYRSGDYGAVVRATVVGRFFAGTRQKFAKGTPWGGYGHMGCCSLLAIQEVRSVDTDIRNDLDYGASPDAPDTDKLDCGYRMLIPFEDQTASVRSQQDEAEAGKRWAFEDPDRVAAEALARLTQRELASVSSMRQTREGQGRRVYEWRPSRRPEVYMVVVSRPYWLQFYSKDPKRVAWVAVQAYESCAENTSAERVR